MKKETSTKQKTTKHETTKHETAKHETAAIKKPRKKTGNLTVKKPTLENTLPIRYSKLVKNMDIILGNEVYVSKHKNAALFQKYLLGEIMAIYVEKIKNAPTPNNPKGEFSAVEMENILKE